MKRYETDRIRNIGLFGHGGAGKTSLTEAFLFASKATSRLGRVEEGNTVSDYDPDEIRRRVSISLAVAPVEWHDHKLNIIDAPGYADFIGDVRSAARVADTALFLLDASAGVEVGTEQAWAACTERGARKMIFVNKLDRENASFGKTLDSARQVFGGNLVALQIPIGQESHFHGIVDLLHQKAYRASGNRDGAFAIEAAPAEMQAEIDSYREQLVERVAETDEALTEKYLEGQGITDEELTVALHNGIRGGQLIPVFCGSATQVIGVTQLLDELVELAISPAEAGPWPATDSASGKSVEVSADPNGPLAAIVFKTLETQFGRQSYLRVYSGTLHSNSHAQNTSRGKDERIGQLQCARGKDVQPVEGLAAGDIGVVAKLSDTHTGDTLATTERALQLPAIEFPAPLYEAAIVPRTKTDLDKLGPALTKMLIEDPVLTTRRSDAAETVVGGMSESHILVVAERMARKFGVTVDSHLPIVPYRETVSTPARRIEYRHKKQSGGAGQYGHVFLDIEPLPEADFEFTETVFGGSVPRQYIPGVEKGVREAILEGPLAGYPLQNIKVTLTDGSYHDVDSSEIAFKIAASQAVKKGALAARPVLLEPVMKVEIDVPESYMGDIMSDLNTKRAQVLGMAPSGNGQTTIEAMVPLAEIQRYSTDLRAITQGRGLFRMQFDHYQTVPAHVAENVISAAKKVKEAAG